MFGITTVFTLIAAICICSSISSAIPHSTPLLARQADYPVFPDQPPSCPICAQNYANIDSCAQAAPVLANFSMVLFNPGAFIDVIKCACTDTFQSVYPQCVDCFEKTDQTAFLNTTDVPDVVTGIRNVCALASTLVGGAPSADGEVSSTSSVASPTPTAATNRATLLRPVVSMYPAGVVLLVSVLLVLFAF